jgi:WD40 repeat protein
LDGVQMAGRRLSFELPALAATFDADSKHIVTHTSDNVTKVWDQSSGKRVSSIARDGKRITEATFSPDGRWLMTASPEDGVILWDLAAGNNSGRSLKFGERLLAMGSRQNGSLVAFWAGKDSEKPSHSMFQIRELESDELLEKHSFPDALVDASFGPDGNLFVVCSGNNAGLRRLEQRPGDFPDDLPHAGTVRSARFSPDGMWIVTASDDETAQVWNVKHGYGKGEPMRHEGPVKFAAFSADGARILTVENRTIRVWDAKNGKPLTDPLYTPAIIRTASFSPDGRRIMFVSEDNVARVWDVAVDFLDLPLPNWVPRLAAALSRPYSVDKRKSASSQENILELRKELLALKGDDFWSRLGRWVAAPPAERTISPTSDITVSEHNRSKAETADPAAK